MDESRKRRKYKQISIADKLKIIQRLEAGEANKTLAAEYGVSHAAISYITKQKENLKGHSKLLDNQQGNPKKTRIDAVENSLLERVTFQWFRQKRSLGEPVFGTDLQKKALMFNEMLQGPKSFAASSGWITRFKHRHGIRELAIQGEKLSSEIVDSAYFKERLKKVIRDEGYDLDNVYNADETGLAWKSLPQRTFAGKNETTATGQKVPKDRVTVMTCANATGSHKINLLVIGKPKNPRCFENSVNLPVNYKSQKSAWIDRSLFEEWYRTEFLPSVTSRKTGANEKFLLLLDNAPSHPPAHLLNAIDSRCTVMYLPPDVTALIQPMHQGIIEAMKKNYRKAFLRNLLLEDCTDNSHIGDFLKRWTLLDCCRTIAGAWDILPDSTLRNGWKLLLDTSFTTPSLKTAGELTFLLNRLKTTESEYSVDETEKWLRIDDSCGSWEDVSEEKIVATACDTPFVEAKIEEWDEDESNDEDPTPDLPKPREVLAAMDMVARWYESRCEAQPEDFRSLRKMRNDALDVALIYKLRDKF